MRAYRVDSLCLMGASHCKNLFLTNRQGTDFYLLLLGANKKFRTADISKQLCVSRLSFTSPEQLMDKLSLLPGAVTPLALIHDRNREVVVVIDEEVARLDMVCVHPCTSVASYAISGNDLMRFLGHLGNEVRYIAAKP